jgi:hypothetical protein
MAAANLSGVPPLRSKCPTMNPARLPSCPRFVSPLLALLCLAATPQLGSAAEHESSGEKTAFFEQHVRPTLVEHCYPCHSESAQLKGKLKGGLFLDTRAGILKGGDTGPAVIAGDSLHSLLLKAVRWESSDTQMPPKKKLPAELISHLEHWIAMGAPDPREGAGGTVKKQIDIAKGREHWAFQPLRPSPPPGADSLQAGTQVDRFLAAAQNAAGVRPAAPASKETLVRRVHFDLTGLPPSPEVTEAFVKDASPDAFARLVDSLLESPRYGERWGRHWLDVVRFAESGGYEFDGFRPGAFHYRDWVIRSFNNDRPYDEFVRLQLAGDLLDSDKVEGAAATGFLVAGPYPGQITAKTRERIRYDQLDDMLSTTGSAMLGLTIGCVRCHDHKYDPIPQADYYSLAATLARAEHGEIKLERSTPEQNRARAEYKQKSALLEKSLSDFAAGEFPRLFQAWREKQSPEPGQSLGRWQIFDPASASAENAHLSPSTGGLILYRDNKIKDDLYTVKVRTFQKGVRAFRLEALADKELPKNGPGLADNGNFVLSDFKVLVRPLTSAANEKPRALKLAAVQASFEQQNFPLSKSVDNDPASGWGIAPQTGKDHLALFQIDGESVGFEGGTEIEFQLRFKGFFGLGKFRLAFSTSENGPELEAGAQPQDSGELLSIEKLPSGSGLNPLAQWFGRFNPQAAAIAAALDAHAAETPRRDYVQVYSTKEGGADVYLLRRGEVDNKAELAKPGFIQVLSAAPAARWTGAAEGEPPSAGLQGTHPRVALGRWLTDPEQGAGHLLARVIVNRVWQHHFGKGLVATPNDFGVQGEKPTHPELLDYLAAAFIRDGWRFKNLHRLLLNSAAYQLGAAAAPASLALDPDNRLFWFHSARRLEAEAIRDSLLHVAGTLDFRPYGPSETRLESQRRSVYLRVRRSELIPFLTLFDAPEPLQSLGERGLTTVPTQALTLLNSPFVRDCASKLANRFYATGDAPEEAFAKAFRFTLARQPSPAELKKYTAYLRRQLDQNPSPESARKALSQTCAALLCTNEFIYID